MNYGSFNHQNHTYDLLYINYINSFFTFQTYQKKKEKCSAETNLRFSLHIFFMHAFLTDVTSIRVVLFEKQINHNLLINLALIFKSQVLHFSP